MRSGLRTLARHTLSTLHGRSMTTSIPRLSRTSKNNLPVRDGESSSPKAPAARPKPTVYNSNITGSGSDPRRQLTGEQNKEVDEHNRHFTKKHALEDRANDRGGPRH
ncbi:hypothetical protein MGU_08982 [Metarhizium guizhouense ARSEF 977]|uniref:Uncharacterized protein n=1 Tax=Metarhizium guizhouense (strain ARSEF 977) TaxID=1276136 RepID=A0A0B4H1Y8_METGA|nr:hypothetical protein MGU_08982 [Metarhizium guizhouense ARSEF 977]